MRRIAFLLFTVATLAALAGYTGTTSLIGAQEAAPIFVTKIRLGYRDWRFISVAHEEGNLNSFAAILGNDVAIEAYRNQTIPFPDGSIMAALHYRFVPSDENNKIFGRDQSFIAGGPTNIHFMVKDSTKYASTGGWGFGHFNSDGKTVDDAFMKTCFPCHQKMKERDLALRATHLDE